MEQGSVKILAFSFLQPEFKKKGLAPEGCEVSLQPGDNIQTILKRLGIDDSLVEGSFINGLVQPIDTPLNNGDRIALVPPGTPGPYRHILGIRNREK